MKKIMLMMSLSGIIPLSHAGPGDDIWDSLGLLSRQVSILQTKVTATETKLSRLENKILLLENELHKPTKPKHSIGECFHGGLIFWLDSTGEHGLIVSTVDVNEGAGIQWRNGESGSRNTNALAEGIGAGESNTKLIIATQTIDNPKGKFAALVAANFQTDERGEGFCDASFNEQKPCFGGWYLPSSYELKLLYSALSKKGFASLSPDFYWSSTESSVSKAWTFNFSSGEPLEASKSNTLGRIRAISKF